MARGDEPSDYRTHRHLQLLANPTLREEPAEEENSHGNIYVTGNTVIDALHMVVDKLKTDAALAEEQNKVLLEAGYDVTRLNEGRKLVLITGHRRENFGDGFIRMVTAMKDLSEKYPEVDFRISNAPQSKRAQTYPRSL